MGAAQLGDESDQAQALCLESAPAADRIVVAAAVMGGNE